MADKDIQQMIRKDIEERLRDCGCCSSDEAADEIERLRNELVSKTNKLRTERDEARRRFCEYAIQHGTTFRRTPQEVAEIIGWDCFRENS